MQRRAAAVYGVLFLVLALGSYGMIAAASAPTVSVANPDHAKTNGSQLTVDGRTYDVAVDNQSVTATLSWVNESATHTATWENDSDITFQGTNFSVATDTQADPKRVELTEVQTLDENATTTTVNDTEYVVVGEGDNRTLVERDEYLRQQHGEPETREFAVGDTVEYRDNSTTLTEVTNESATLEWTGPRTETVDAAEGDVVTLNGQEFVAHFPNPDRLVLDRDVQAYRDQQAVIDNYHQRINGLWGVSILSALAFITLLGLSYLPSRY